jgi:putative methyltransferase (TIGR04325 family)
LETLRPWPALRQLRGAITRLPPIQGLRAAKYEREFGGNFHGAFCGVYRSFDEALRSAPAGRPAGFDVPGVAEQDVLRSRVDRVFPYDYPVLFWLRPVLTAGVVVFDFGGHVGVHYHAYRRLLDFPPRLRWVVCELPAVVEAGRRLAAERAAAGLSFTTSTADADGAEILLSAGTLQYVEEPSLAELLGSLANPPRHVLISKLPLTDGEPFFTLQHGGIHFPAVRVCNRTAFLDSLQAVGYELVDAWEDHVHSVVVPFHPERTVPWFSGLYLRRVDRAEGAEVRAGFPGGRSCSTATG